VARIPRTWNSRWIGEPDIPAEQRGREQVIHDQHPEARVENGGLNKNKPISDNNPKRQEYLDAAKRVE